jgi:hypothetical protein
MSVTLAKTAAPVVPAKNVKPFAVTDAMLIAQIVKIGGEDATLVAMVKKANYASPELKDKCRAAWDWIDDCAALVLAGKELRYMDYTPIAQAHHLSMVKGSTSKTKVKASEGKTRLIDDAQQKRNVNHNQRWSRLLKKAGVAAAQNAGNTNAKKKKAANVFATPEKAIAYFSNEAMMMLKTVQANKRAGSIHARHVAPFAKAIADLQLTFARIAKKIKADNA